MIDFTTTDYLKSGTPRQKRAYTAIQALGIFEHLTQYRPVLAGTLPLDIDLPESDLDIICECEDHVAFAKRLSKVFTDTQNFQCNVYEAQGMTVTTATFRAENFEIEIFGQNLPSVRQRAFKHMMVEYQILQQRGDKFKAAIKRLRAEGYKTEPAFAQLLGLEGNPYEALLKYGEAKRFI